MVRYRTPLGTHGVISTRKRNRRWEARTTVRTASGEYVRKYASGGSKTEAVNLLLERVQDAAPLTDLNRRSSIQSLGEQWRLNMLTKGLAPRTVDRYEWTLEKHINHYIGRLTIEELTTSRAQSFLVMLQDKHGAGVAKGARTVLLQMYTMAVQDDIVQRNPVQDTTLRRADRKEVESFTAEQIPTLRKNLNGDVLDVFDVMLGTGLRISEVLAIRWEDIDFSQNRLQVTGAVKRTKREGLHRGAPKSLGSMQWLYLPDFAMRPLRERERWCELVFPTSTGGLWEPTNFRKQWRKQLAGTAYASAHPHMVRSTVATILAQSEGTLAASKQLGHSSESITAKHYIARPDEAPNLSQILNRLL